jgi:hypothetical protein
MAKLAFHMRLVAAVALVALWGSALAQEEEESRPHVLVHKALDLDEGERFLAAHLPFRVSYKLINTGKECVRVAARRRGGVTGRGRVLGIRRHPTRPRDPAVSH